MIWGIGTDIVECARVQKLVEAHDDHLADRLFTQREVAYCKSHKKWAERFAGRFAAKEAVFKALGTGWRKGLGWTDIEIINETTGKPVVHLQGQAKELADQHHISQILISISHCETYATAYALALLENNPNP